MADMETPEINYDTVRDDTNEFVEEDGPAPRPGSLEEQLLTELRDSYTDTDDRVSATQKIQNLDKQLRAYLTRFIPKGVVPVFVTPAQSDTRVDSEFGSATWSEYSSQGDLAGADDNYCRKMESGDWYYPRRNTASESADQVELANCGKVMNDEVEQIADITARLPVLITRAKLRYIKSDTSPNDPVNSARAQLLRQVQDYETIHRQYLQLVRNVNTNTDILKRRSKTVDTSAKKLDGLENDLEIRKSVFNDWTTVEDGLHSRNQTLIQWSRWGLWVLWILMVTLILFANTNFVVQN
jgi:hypothetical protein